MSEFETPPFSSTDRSVPKWIYHPSILTGVAQYTKLSVLDSRGVQKDVKYMDCSFCSSQYRANENATPVRTKLLPVVLSYKDFHKTNSAVALN